MIRSLPLLFGGSALLIGVFSLAVAGFFGEKTFRVVQGGLRAEAEVVGLDRRQSSRPNSYVYAPVFRFTAQDGQAYEVRSSVASNPPAHALGDRVPVVYRPEAPEDAVLDSFLELWSISLIAGSIGLVFFALGAWTIGSWLKKQRDRAWLLQHGTRIKADIQSIEINRRIAVNRSHPFQIIAQGTDPSASGPRLFRSENLWVNPAPFLGGRTTIEVLVDPERPKRYWIDTSFLP